MIYLLGCWCANKGHDSVIQIQLAAYKSHQPAVLRQARKEAKYGQIKETRWCHTDNIKGECAISSARKQN